MTRNELTKLWTKITSLFARKTDLNNKQDVINDLNDIRNGAALGTTALLSYTETDPTVPSWAKLSTKPSYSYNEISNTPTLATVATSGSYNDLIGIPDIPDEIKVSPVKGRMHRTNVSGSGNVTITSASGIGFPNAPVTGNSFTYDVAIYMRSTTPGTAYSLTANFGNTSYTLAAVNGVISDVRSITTDDDSLWTGSISSGSVGANSEIIVVIYQNVGPTVKTVGPAAITNNYADLNGLPTIPTIPTNVSAFTNDAGYLTSHQDISGKQDTLTAGDGIAIDSTDTIRTTGIPFGRCDSTSTATVFTATVPGIYKLEDGVCCMIENGVVTSASGFTLNVNGLGGKPCYTNLAAATRDTTIFNIAYTMLFVYDETRVSGGCWICYRGYDANTNTIGYQVRTNSSSLPASLKFYRYRLLFTSADGTHYVPANTSSSTNATASRTVNQTPIDPFGHIVYYGTTAAVEANARPSAAYLWVIYTLNLGYSFNRTDAALTLDDWAPVYIKCAPQANGSAIIDADTPYVQALPSIADGKIYIFLGVAYSATNIELLNNHPVYYHDGTGIRLWTGSTGGGDLSNYYTKTEVDTALSGKQATLVSGTNIKTINNESLLGSGNIDIQGGGSSMSITYNANTQALVIRGGSMNTYTITFSDNAYIVDMEINGQSTQYDLEPVAINEGDSFSCRATNTGNSGNTVVMGGVDITSSALTLITKDDGPITEYECQISIPSVTGDVSIVVSSYTHNPYS